MNDFLRLRAIVANNPFDRDLVGQWRGQMLEARTKTSIEQLENCQFLLPYDEHCQRFRQAFLENQGGILADSRVQLQFLPLPFIGSPSADVWYIQINPGASDLDFYEMFNVNRNVKRQIQERLAEAGRRKLQVELGKTHDERKACRLRRKIELCTPDSFEFVSHGEEEANNLVLRQELYLRQFDLSLGHHDFYPLSPCFETCRLRVVRPHIGSRKWWKPALCFGKGDALFRQLFDLSRDVACDLGDSLFVMEYFPYHSGNAHLVRQYRYPEEHPYWRFLREMLAYAVDMGKTILFRSGQERQMLNLDGTNVRVMQNQGSGPQSVYLNGGHFPGVPLQQFPRPE